MQISNDMTKPMMTAALAVALILGFTASAWAGSGGEEFSSVYDTLVDWSQGTLGRIISITMILVGMGMAVVRMTLVMVVVAIGGGLILYNAPTVIESIQTAAVLTADQQLMVSMLANTL